MPGADPKAERIFDTAPLRPFRGTVWRVHWREVDPADWSLSLRTSGRYHRGLDLFPPEQAFAVLYTSLAPEIAIWEMVRRSAARNLTFLKNNVLSELSIELPSVLDVSDPAVVDITHGELTSNDYRVCQDIAAQANARAYNGLLVPSAALPGTNLVIFAGSLAAPLPIRVVRRTELPLERIVGESTS